MGASAGQGSASYTSTDHNVIIGMRAGYRISSNSDNNTYLGEYAGYYNTDGDNNTILGAFAGQGTADYTGSDNNILIGRDAGHDIGSNQDGNIFIGYQAGYSESGSNKLYIENSNSASPLIGGDFSADTLDFNASITQTSAATSGTAYSLLADSLTTGTGLDISIDAITSGVGLNLTSTSTSTTAPTTARLAYLNWAPGSSTTIAGDLFRLNIGPN
ncbi:MAG: hypothetical protein IH946_13030, partial [Bacteroidetes bacterium]|nr:hypothetical protein [Bacteroidota bacterium]